MSNSFLKGTHLRAPRETVLHQALAPGSIYCLVCGSDSSNLSMFFNQNILIVMTRISKAKVQCISMSSSGHRICPVQEKSGRCWWSRVAHSVTLGCSWTKGLYISSCRWVKCTNKSKYYISSQIISSCSLWNSHPKLVENQISNDKKKTFLSLVGIS